MADVIKADKGMPSRNKFFGSEQRAKGLTQSGIPSKNPTEAIPDTGSHETAPERGMNELREDKGS